MKELGDTLKSERLKQGLTLKTASEMTHVSVSMLQNLEEGNFDQIGTPLLIRGFVRSYCSVLGIDPVTLLDKYENEILRCDQMEEAIKRYGKWSRSFHKKSKLGVLAAFMSGLIAVGALYGGAWFYNKRVRQSAQTMKTAAYPQQEFPSDLREGTVPSSNVENLQVDHGSSDQSRLDKEEAETPAPPGAEASPQESIVSGQPAIETAVTAEAAPTEKPAPVVTKEDERHRLEIEADQKSWVRVVLDGKKTEDAMLEPGDRREWNAQEKLQIVIGNAPGVHLKWDGETINPPIPKGRVLRLQLPDQTLTSGQKIP